MEKHGDGLVARLNGIDDRDVAVDGVKDIRVRESIASRLEESDYYWHQLRRA